jgi:hypothetical protein
VDSRDAWGQPWYDFIMLQGGHSGVPGAEVYQGARDHLPTRPVLEGECRYDHIRGFTDADVREAAYHALQAGCFGYTYGAHGIWYPTQNAEDDLFWQDWGVSPPWWEALLYPGGDQMGYMKSLYTSLEWWRLAPQPGLASRSEVLVMADGTRTLLAYFTRGLEPTAAASVQGTAAAHRYRATWFNPRTGASTALAETLTSVSGAIRLPDRADSQDWVLTLRDLDDPVEVPALTGYPRGEAENLLRARGLLAEFSGYGGQNGFVAEQDPAAGTMVAPESTVILDMAEGEETPGAFHAADTNQDGLIDLSEVLRVIQIYRWGAYHCETDSVDGYAADGGDATCPAHTADYAPKDWQITLAEVLRVLQLSRFGPIAPCMDGEDGYCAG